MKLNFAAPLLAAVILLTLSATPLRADLHLLASPASQAQDSSNDTSGTSDSDGLLSSALGNLIPIITIVMGCSIPIVIVVAVCYFNHRKTQMLHETVRKMVEKGVPIPPELLSKSGGDWSHACPPGTTPFQAAFGPSQPRNDLRTGVLMTGIGIGLTIFIGNAGAIVLFLGIAFILVGIFQKKKPAPEQPPKP